MVASSAFSLLPQPTDCAPHSHSTSSAAKLTTPPVTTWTAKNKRYGEAVQRRSLLQSVGTACLDFPTVLAAPNANSFPLHRILQQKVQV